MKDIEICCQSFVNWLLDNNEYYLIRKYGVDVDFSLRFWLLFDFLNIYIFTNLQICGTTNVESTCVNMLRLKLTIQYCSWTFNMKLEISKGMKGLW